MCSWQRRPTIQRSALMLHKENQESVSWAFSLSSLPHLLLTLRTTVFLVSFNICELTMQNRILTMKLILTKKSVNKILFSHWFHSYNKYFWTTYFMQGTALDRENHAVIKWIRIFAFTLMWEVTCVWTLWKKYKIM